MRKTTISLLLIALLFYAASFIIWRMQQISAANDRAYETACALCPLFSLLNLEFIDYAIGLSLLPCVGFYLCGGARIYNRFKLTH